MFRTSIFAAAFAASALACVPASAEPGGCLKYGAAGAVAGHFAHHGVKGFMAGCAVGMLRRHEYRKQMREQARAGIAPGAPGSAPGAPDPVAR